MSLEHYRNLENMFHAAPIQKILSGAEMKVSEGKATYKLAIKQDYFHAAEAMHGAIYFKMLDDAAYFAAASMESTYFLLTKTYNIEFIRPVLIDQLIAVGEIISVEENRFLSKSSIQNSARKVVATGEGIFVRSKKLLANQGGYLPLI
ncbi:PaaI family thioesterase [Roseivirga misakiensis]|uniref:Thioesterase domain-containing protein n=1 Tax=Roseivirga misakiensis TaxID=1563681 RepID=A0A1E5T598_9BACT|nr:PaaI family thioesterase [Roseivirga misakiensis]OEK06549.1 hypothetical protein BFP71_02440 [Roseivirga misakiensis]